MADSDELTDQIASNAGKVARASGDGESAEQHPLRDQIAAAKFVAANRTVKQRNRGVLQTKLSPPGSV